MNYGKNYGDGQSIRFCLFADLNNQNMNQNYHLGSGLHTEPVEFVFLPFDPDELVDQLKMLD